MTKCAKCFLEKDKKTQQIRKLWAVESIPGVEEKEEGNKMGK
jgi:hypothetical protein